MSATQNTTFKKPSYGTNEWCRKVSAPSSWEKEVKHEALCGSGLAFLYYKKNKKVSLSRKSPLSVKEQKKAYVSYFQASSHSVLHPSMFLESRNHKPLSSFLKVPAILWFFPAWQQAISSY